MLTVCCDEVTLDELEVTSMPLEISRRCDIRELHDSADGEWEGSGANSLGLTGTATREDLIRVFNAPEEPLSLIDQMRLDGTYP